MIRRESRGALCVALCIFAISAAAVSFAQDKPEQKPPADKPVEKKGDEKPADPRKPAIKPMDIADTAATREELKVFVELVKTADLFETLKDQGPFTVFAPTDEAWGKLGKETIDELKKPENKTRLQSILKNHILEGRHPTPALAKHKSVKTQRGQEVAVAMKDGKTSVGGAALIEPEIECANGILHIIDAVILPKEEPR